MKNHRSSPRRLLIMTAAVLLTSALIAAAALMMYLFAQTSAVPEQATKTIQVVSMGAAPACGMDRFYEELDALTVPELGIRVRVEYIPWGQEGIRLSRVIQNGEADILCGGAWSYYSDYAQKNAFVDLEPLLDVVPALKQALMDFAGPEYLSIVGTNGGLYGIPEMISAPTIYGVLYREDLRLAWGLEELTDFDALERYLYRAAQEGYDAPVCDEGIMYHLWNLIAGNRYMFIPNMGDHFVVRLEDPGHACLWYEMPEYRQCLEILQRWYQDGIVRQDILVGMQRENTADMALDRMCIDMTSHLDAVDKYYIPVIMDANPDYQLRFLPCGMLAEGFPYYKGMPSSTMVSISSRSASCGEALRFIEKVFTDERYAHLVRYGVEGLNYVNQGGSLSYEGIASDNIHRSWTGMNNDLFKLPSASAYPSWNESLQQARGFVADQMALQNTRDPFAGFSCDMTQCRTALETFTELVSGKWRMLNCGVTASVEEDLAGMLAALHDAGSEEVLADLNGQLAAWFARAD
ncbi:MAG: DUF3502 domain-containing protein [Aristaeellaceae bacterium]